MKSIVTLIILVSLGAVAQTSPPTPVVQSTHSNWLYYTNIVTNITAYEPLILTWQSPNTNSHTYLVEASTDLYNWHSLSTYSWNASTNTTNVLYTNWINVCSQKEFYRVRYNSFVELPLQTNK